MFTQRASIYHCSCFSEPCIAVDPKIMRESLHEFHGLLEENPKNFFSVSVDSLKQNNLSEEILILAQQLKGPAATWEQSEMSRWTNFKRELLLGFDSEGVKIEVEKVFSRGSAYRHASRCLPEIFTGRN